MKTITRVHQFSPAAFVFKAEPPQKQELMRTAFQCNAYSQGQWCLPYSVPVRRLRWANGVRA